MKIRRPTIIVKRNDCLIEMNGTEFILNQQFSKFNDVCRIDIY